MWRRGRLSPKPQTPIGREARLALARVAGAELMEPRFSSAEEEDSCASCSPDYPRYPLPTAATTTTTNSRTTNSTRGVLPNRINTETGSLDTRTRIRPNGIDVIMQLPSLSAVLLGAFAWTASALEPEDNIKSISLRTHSLQQPYLDSDMQSRWYDFGGDTIVRTDSYIRLSSDRPSQSGWMFSRVPLTATNWEIEVEFKISGKNQLYGDGFAMWITRQRAQMGPVFGGPDKFEGLGIFVDTYKNNRPGVVFPYVMAMHGDGQTTYDKNNDGKNTELAGCSARGIRHASVPTKLRLTYFQDKQLKLELQYKTEGEWQLCFETESPPAIPNIAYLGFTAETGELSDNHDIISVTAKNLYASPGAPGRSSSTSKSRGSKAGKKAKKQGGSWMWFFVKVFLVVGVAGGAYVGYTAWRARNKAHRF
ncbi:hypothetical protein G7046_g8301 [Stylonectria norvegica]|nr:hypothetical protein G7046_g8301 [Stylonectria norvegica]